MRYETIVCLNCGASWYGPKCGRKYCSKCQKAMSKERQRLWRERQKHKEVKKESLSLIEVVRLADAAGMSYAKYCLKYGI